MQLVMEPRAPNPKVQPASPTPRRPFRLTLVRRRWRCRQPASRSTGDDFKMPVARSRIFQVSVFLLAAVSVSRDARAVDTKVYSGAGCRQIGGGDLTAINGSFLSSLSVDPIMVSCPILRDDALSTKGWSRIDIFVRDETPAAAIECMAFTREPDGTVHIVGSGSTGVETVTPGVALWEEITIQGSDADNSAVPEGTYGLVCTLPGIGDGIGGYRVVEP